MTELERLYQNRHRAAWRAVYRRRRKDPAAPPRDGYHFTKLEHLAMYALGFEKHSGRAG